MKSLDVLFLVGVILLCGFIGGKLSSKLKFPSVVGFLVAGVFIGPSFCKLFNLQTLDSFGVFNDLALSLIAYIIGNEMPVSTIRKMGKGIITIIFSESIGAFILVALGVYLLTKKISLALIFGAMAPASAPAGTAIVLQENKAKGPLTTSLYTVVGLDDGLAIMIYAFAIAFAKVSLVGGHISFMHIIKGPVIEICGALALGGISGIVCGFLLTKISKKEDVLPFALAFIFMCTGISKYFHFSLILSNLIFGMVLASTYISENRKIINAITFLITPIYILFFVIAGAHLQIKHLPSMGLIGLIYIVCRS
ncbi:MAG: cation:proton antiporter, partial [bacterium]